MTKPTLDQRLLAFFGTPVWPLVIYEAVALFVLTTAGGYYLGLHALAIVFAIGGAFTCVPRLALWILARIRNEPCSPLPWFVTMALLAAGAAVSYGSPELSAGRTIGDATVVVAFLLSRFVLWHPRLRPFPGSVNHAA